MTTLSIIAWCIKLLPGICQLIVTLAIVILFACTFAIYNKILLTYLLITFSSGTQCMSRERKCEDFGFSKTPMCINLHQDVQI